MKRTQFNVIDGVVVDTTDPQQMGRMKVWCPAIDGDAYTIESLPWVTYVSPMAGQTRNYPAGSKGSVTHGFHSYGLWAIPKVGATVLIAILYGDVNKRFYIGSFFNDHGNRSLPVGRNRPDLGNKAPVSDTFDPIEPQTTNLNLQFNNNLDAPQAKTRGAYERQVAQDSNTKDGTEGYQKGVVDSDLDPQTYCLTTPGRHSIIFQDNPSNAKVRIKSADGHQIIMDDANERIYVSTNKGKTWLELDSDGHVNLYGASSVSVGSAGDINLSANGSINMAAGANVNIAAAGYFRATACGDASISGSAINIESGGEFNILASGTLLQTAEVIHLNGPTASAAPCATSPSIIPDHEPWVRPVSAVQRGPNWKE